MLMVSTIETEALEAKDIVEESVTEILSGSQLNDYNVSLRI